jgi:hypothetical protein
MDEKLIGVIVLMMCCLSSSVSFAMSMGGGEDDSSGGAAGAGGAGAGSTPKPPPKYQSYPNYDFSGSDIKCEGNIEASVCESRCDTDDKCVSYIHTTNDKLCCTKFGTANYKEIPGRTITGYIKNIDGYEVKEVGDRPAGDIENIKPATLPTCKARCDELSNCIGFNFNNDNCWIKKADGIAQTYSVNGYQFYTKKT